MSEKVARVVELRTPFDFIAENGVVDLRQELHDVFGADSLVAEYEASRKDGYGLGTMFWEYVSLPGVLRNEVAADPRIVSMLAEIRRQNLGVSAPE